MAEKMSQYYELGVKLAANPYAGPGGFNLFVKDMGTLTGLKMPKMPASPGLPGPPKPATAGNPPQPASPSAPGANVPGGPPAGPGPYFGGQNVMLAGSAARQAAKPIAYAADSAGKKVPGWLGRFSGYQQGRTWGQFGKSMLPRQGWLASKVLPKSWTNSLLPQAAATGLRPAFAAAAGKMLPAGLGNIARVSGPVYTPIMAATEVMDAAGVLPQWAGGTGLLSPGWAPRRDFAQQTSVGGPGDTLGYQGPGWQGLGYLGAALNASAKPLRSTYELLEEPITGSMRLYDIGSGMLRNQQTQKARAGRTAWSPEEMNRMARNMSPDYFYHDTQLGHMMPTAAFFNEDQNAHGDLYRQRIRATAGSPAWQPQR